MNRYIKACLLLQTICLGALAQTKQTWQNQQFVLVDFIDQRGLRTMDIDDKGVLKLDKLPEKLVIRFPEKDYANIRITFNQAKDVFNVGFGTAAKNFEPLSLADFNEGSVELNFRGGELVKVGNRSIEPRKITGDKPFIQLQSGASAGGPKEMETVKAKVAQQPIIFDTAKVNAMIKCIRCQIFPACINDTSGKSSGGKPNGTSNGKGLFAKKDSNRNIYMAEYDDVTGALHWFDINGKPIRDVSKIRPKARSEFYVSVKGLDTVKYSLSAEGESFFGKGSEQFGKVLDAAIANFAGDTAKKDSNKLGPDKAKPPSTSKAEKWKNDLLALDKVLEYFNWEFENIDFREGDYSKALANMQQGIKSCLGIPVTDSEEDLKTTLINGIKTLRDDELDPYETELLNLISAIEKEYKKAQGKTTHRRLFQLQVQIPNDDQVTLSLKSDKTDAKLINRTFNVKGGFKIDFSSGIFFTWLGSPDFVLARSVFQYRETRDTVIVRPGGDPKDSIMYTGSVKETSGNLIRQNENKITYGAGFFAHGYWRSGGSVNVGMAVGLVMNNTGSILATLGPSLMFNAGSQRISLLGGIAVGKVRHLSASSTDFLYKPEYAGFENGRTIFANAREVPHFYNETEIKTYEKWDVNFFVGVSFNFASITTGKK
jgi:hypothetical protein